MKYFSVCSGIEAATVAWHPLGWEPVAVCEKDPFASAVLAHHWPNVPNLGDMTKHENWHLKLGSVDLLVGGTPCQSFSVAGLRKGLADPRGNLALTYLAILDKLRPRWCVWENVPGVLSSSGGRDFGAFLGALAELGYGFAYRVLDAQFCRVDGYERAVPQRRRRVFVVGDSRGSAERCAEVLFESSSVRGDSSSRRKTRQTPASGVDGRAASGRVRTDIPAWPNALTAGLRLSIDQELFIPEVCGTIADGAHYGGGANGQDAYSGRIIPAISHTLSSEGYDASEDGTGRGTPLVYSITPASGQGATLRATELDVASGIDVTGLAKVTDRGVRIVDRLAVRRLTPRECERLQGFPDDHTLVPHRGKDALDGPRYRAIGNSMAVNVMRWIGRRIEAVEGKR